MWIPIPGGTFEMGSRDSFNNEQPVHTVTVPPFEMTETNLREIIRRCREQGAEVLLLGMRMPPNFGDYAIRFEELFGRLAEEFSIGLVPFLLEGVGGHAELNQPDGIHPNEEGHRLLAANVTPALANLLRELGS